MIEVEVAEHHDIHVLGGDALGLGAGGEGRAPMARAVVGGLLTSTLLTLLVVPVMYTYMDDFGTWLKRKWKGKGHVAH